MSAGFFRKYAYGILTLAFFTVSLGLHWLFGWYAYKDEALEHRETPSVSSYAVEMGRDTFENWQSEFLQLIWQVAGLAYFLYLGSPASKENDDRLEAKVDVLLRLVGREEGERAIQTLDEHYLRTHGHAQPYGHEESAARNAGRLAVPGGGPAG